MDNTSGGSQTSPSGPQWAQIPKFTPEVRAEVISLLRQLFVERAAIPAAARPNPWNKITPDHLERTACFCGMTGLLSSVSFRRRSVSTSPHG